MKIILHKFSEKDIEERVRWINHPLINHYMYFELPVTVDSTKKWFTANKENQERVDFTFKKEKGRIAAMGGLVNINTADKNAEFYIMVNPDDHGKGYGLIASQAIFNYGFSHYNLHKIYLYTDAKNKAASRLYEKMGLSLEGVLREHKRYQDTYINRSIYSLLRTEWERSNWKEEVRK